MIYLSILSTYCDQDTDHISSTSPESQTSVPFLSIYNYRYSKRCIYFPLTSYLESFLLVNMKSLNKCPRVSFAKHFYTSLIAGQGNSTSHFSTPGLSLLVVVEADITLLRICDYPNPGIYLGKGDTRTITGKQK